MWDNVSKAVVELLHTIYNIHTGHREREKYDSRRHVQLMYTLVFSGCADSECCLPFSGADVGFEV